MKFNNFVKYEIKKNSIYLTRQYEKVALLKMDLQIRELNCFYNYD